MTSELPTPRNVAPDDNHAVLVVITAYNSPKALRRCLETLDRQTRLPDGVLIVDNSQPRPVEIEHDGETVKARTRVVRPGSNLGPAGGFALGLATFLEEPHWTHAWVMDDDSYPDPDALASLLATTRGLPSGSLVFSTTVNELTGVAENNPGWSGLLLDRTAVDVGGLPRADFFWWAEDTEYLQHRLPTLGIAVARAESAVVRYDLVRRAGGRPPWKYYYEVRNSIYYRLYIQGPTRRRLYKLIRTLVRLQARALTGPDRGMAVAMYYRGVRDGLTKRLGIRVIPPVTKGS